MDLLFQCISEMLLFYACVHKTMGLLGCVNNAALGYFLTSILIVDVRGVHLGVKRIFIL